MRNTSKRSILELDHSIKSWKKLIGCQAASVVLEGEEWVLGRGFSHHPNPLRKLKAEVFSTGNFKNISNCRAR
jgi:hypothetical protein